MEVDVERLARAMWESYMGYITRIPWEQTYKKSGMIRQAEAAMSDLTAQGMVVVRREDLARVVERAIVFDQRHLVESGSHDFGPVGMAALNRLRAALTAAPAESGPVVPVEVGSR